ncbi:hypothetical protein RLO149_p830200 (plasmid) [Roseobacter litoralis Och 149]|uniref:Uncharacterized protein n=1 Tax=Roseobacter litoralis (strain ATCC 49566 / DSM 6996 / JCM 21268 / NBRC 15278 / OCh 149) TaxID=391595 RepID=F7ZMB4_ROSLO|nr:hypothetical protein RLO149_p830200 [Roseobacter litoralis Och 149]
MTRNRWQERFSRNRTRRARLGGSGSIEIDISFDDIDYANLLGPYEPDPRAVASVPEMLLPDDKF